jgi:hypothetical protein
MILVGNPRKREVESLWVPATLSQLYRESSAGASSSHQP